MPHPLMTHPPPHRAAGQPRHHGHDKVLRGRRALEGRGGDGGRLGGLGERCALLRHVTELQLTGGRQYSLRDMSGTAIDVASPLSLLMPCCACCTLPGASGCQNPVSSLRFPRVPGPHGSTDSV